MNAATRGLAHPKARARNEAWSRMTDAELADEAKRRAKGIATEQSELSHLRRLLKKRRRALRAGQ